MADQDRWNQDRDRRQGDDDRYRRGYREAGRPQDYGSREFGRRGGEERSFGSSDDDHGQRERYGGGQSYGRGGSYGSGQSYGGSQSYGTGQSYGSGRSYGGGQSSGGRGGGSYGGYGEDYGSTQGYGASQDYGVGAGSQRYGSSYGDYQGSQQSGGRYGSSQGYASSQGYGAQQGGQGWRGGREEDRGDHDRNWMERAGEKMASWFSGDRDQDRDREGGSHRGRGPKNYTRSDDRIREDVNDRLTDDPWLDASEIEVTVSKCEVTLSGTVDTREAKRWAEELVENVSGVRHVQNNLRVQSGSTSATGTAGSSASTTSGLAGSGTSTGAYASGAGTPSATNASSGGTSSSTASSGGDGTKGRQS